MDINHIRLSQIAGIISFLITGGTNIVQEIWQNTYSFCNMLSCTKIILLSYLHKIFQFALERLFSLQYYLWEVSPQKTNISHQFKSALKPASQGCLPRGFKPVVLPDNTEQCQHLILKT